MSNSQRLMEQGFTFNRWSGKEEASLVCWETQCFRQKEQKSGRSPPGVFRDLQEVSVAGTNEQGVGDGKR